MCFKVNLVKRRKWPLNLVIWRSYFKVTCANRRNQMRLVPARPLTRLWEAHRCPGHPVTPGTAAAPSLPWNHKVPVSHHLRGAMKAKNPGLKHGSWRSLKWLMSQGNEVALARPLHKGRELRAADTSDPCWLRPSSCGSLRRTALALTLLQPTDILSFPLVWHTAAMDLGLFSFSHCHEGFI